MTRERDVGQLSRQHRARRRCCQRDPGRWSRRRPPRSRRVDEAPACCGGDGAARHERRAAARRGDRSSCRSRPSPAAAAHAEPAVAVHVHVTAVKAAGNASVTETPAAVLGPLLATVIGPVPAGRPRRRSARSASSPPRRRPRLPTVSVTLAVSFAGCGSRGALDRRVAVFTTVPACRDAARQGQRGDARHRQGADRPGPVPAS